MAREQLKGIYAITPEFKEDSALFVWAEQLFQHRVRFLQYRDKQSDLPKKFSRAKTLLTLARRYDAFLIINDDVLLCLETHADGVHLGKNDGSLFLARKLLGEDKILGASCYAALKNAQDAEKLGADYVAFGAVFPSPTKPDAPLVSLSKIALAKMALSIPVCAIGGITKENAGEVLKTGADSLALSSFLLENPEEKIHALLQLFKG